MKKVSATKDAQAASADYSQLTIRAEAAITGVSPSTVHARRQRAAALTTGAPATAALIAEPTVAELQAQLVAMQAQLAAQVLVAANDVDEDERPVAGGTIQSPRPTKVSRDRRRFVLTSAQNNTLVHPGFWQALQVYAAHHGSEILISRFAYNKKGWGRVTKADADLWYDPEIAGYISDESLELAPGLIWCGELDIMPTATDPLGGLDSYTKAASGIVPNAKRAYKSLATMKHEPARFMQTTGAVTQRNYIDRKAGQVASFHHVFGATVVEVDQDGTFFVRELNADDSGSFYDLEEHYSPTGVTNARVEAITWGDFHSEKADAVVDQACFGGPGSILDTLRPREQHVHDLADFTARNHHNIGDPYFRAEMLARGEDLVEADMAVCAAKLARINRDWCTTVVVESNHDEALKRWLREADGHLDAANARYWHYWNYRIFQAIERRESLFVFEHAVREKLERPLPGVRFLRIDDTWVICAEHGGGIQCALHGHLGPNGSRGGEKAFRMLGIRVNLAHRHAPGIFQGSYTAGVSGAMDMGYNRGPSSWSQTHIITYANGKRSLLTMNGGRWRGEPVRQAKPTRKTSSARRAA